MGGGNKRENHNMGRARQVHPYADSEVEKTKNTRWGKEIFCFEGETKERSDEKKVESPPRKASRRGQKQKQKGKFLRRGKPHENRRMREQQMGKRVPKAWKWGLLKKLKSENTQPAQANGKGEGGFSRS